MNDPKAATPSLAGPLALTFLAGAALGAVVAALATPKSGPELRGDLRRLARRARNKAGGLTGEARGAWDDLQERVGQAAGDLQRGFADAAKDIKG